MKRGMKREIIQTGDGSSTLYVPELNEHYHSVHGAVQESLHIFIKTGIAHYKQKNIRILEAGFGTGLNAILSLSYARTQNANITYHSFEKYPLAPEEAGQLNYNAYLEAEDARFFHDIHACAWEKEVEITPYFTLCKHHNDFEAVCFEEEFDIVFFDAFNPDVQPRLWTEEILGNFYRALKKGGILTTYCVKGKVKQALRNLGFSIERLPGPPGKHQILRATK